MSRKRCLEYSDHGQGHHIDKRSRIGRKEPPCLQNTVQDSVLYEPLDDDHKVDSQLAEELLGSIEPTTPAQSDSKPIPLLTPPASPVPIKSDESVVEIYEWPCNLAVDNALTAAMQLRSLSPSSLAKLEDVDQQQQQSSDFFNTLWPAKLRARTVTKDFTSSGRL